MMHRTHDQILTAGRAGLAHLERNAHQAARAAAAAPAPASPYKGASEQLGVRIDAAVEEDGPDLLALSHALHEDPEPGFEEHRAVSRIVALLGARGIEAEVGVHGLPTALRAQVGDGTGPTVAVLAEYDALPGTGHGCGHNIICAAGVGAFLALSRVAEDIGATVLLLGTPAEENGTGKELMARAGAFEGVDAAVMVHPLAGADLTDAPFLGLREVVVEYTGLAAHASASPFMGVNALDAVVAAYQGVSALRQHIPPTDRVHGVITQGGTRPNVVPEHAAAHFYLRAATVEALGELSQRVQRIFEGAAAMTGTRVAVRWDDCPPCLPVRSNDALAARFAQHLRRRGRTALPGSAAPDAAQGSTDLGNVSVRVPAIHPMLAIAPAGVALHTTDFAALVAGEAADRTVLDAAATLARTAADFAADAELRAAVADEFAAAGGALDVEKLLSTPSTSA
ncbi:M20 family metallopeptidase [Streptomyces sp. NBC_00063]|uniref:M20 family metallopeptidase n=1 Tax=Streptomyces sp. NBC_00063 TaxID=2975638 RepID=UPI002259520A|nr:M20 family metallopeptidase [Streptomyces sp. NBC_00063]MCX5435748.1 M20 family metallopeptidase [Streptomyces sp. NBC_00063]